MSKIISIELSDEIAELLDKLSIEVNQTSTELVKEAIEEYIKEAINIHDEWKDESIPLELKNKYSCKLEDLIGKTPDKSKHQEVDFGGPVGKEIW